MFPTFIVRSLIVFSAGVLFEYNTNDLVTECYSVSCQLLCLTEGIGKENALRIFFMTKCENQNLLSATGAVI